MVDAERCAERLLAAADRRAPEVYVPQWWRVAAALQGAAPGLMARVAERAWRRDPRLAPEAAAGVSRPVALVTGGSSGIGLGIARRLLERGCQVVITARGEERLRALVEELGVIGVAADVATEEGRAAIVAEVRRLGRLDWLVNNAGTGGGTAGLDVDVERARPRARDQLLLARRAHARALAAAAASPRARA